MLQFNTADYCLQNNRKLKGSIDPKIILKYKDQTIGTPQTSQANVSIDTPCYKNNRSSDAKKLQQYIVENGGFDWRLYASPTVGRLPNGILRVIDGEHRFNLAKIFTNRSELPVVIVDFDNEAQMSAAFWKKNGGFTTKVTNETQLISQWHADSPYARKLGDILKDVGVVVAEAVDNYIPDTINSKWKIKVRALESVKKISKDLDSIKKAVKLYKESFPKLTKKSGNKHIEITGQLIQALVYIYSFGPYAQWMKDNPSAFADWFKDITKGKQSPKKHLYEVEYPHERMEQRYLGTAYGLLQDCFANLRLDSKDVPSIEFMETAYRAHEKKRAEQKKAA
tara:strand:+ start:378 stop:1391 length:1014 start_codon:yes stop_codon:yes gene_type:complete